MTRTAVILHERLGTWSAQLRPRVQGRPVHWIETRSATDLDKALLGLACPVVLIDLKRNVVEGLSDLDRLMRLFPGARVLVLDPEAHDGVAELARELGATHVISGFVPPPEVACLIDRWITLADLQTDRAGWSRPMTTDTPLDPEEWLQIAAGDRALGSGLQRGRIRFALIRSFERRGPSSRFATAAVRAGCGWQPAVASSSTYKIRFH